MIPNFLIIGAAKAGTTSLYHYVRNHPQAFMPERKELSFFCEEFNWSRGLRWYTSHFEDAGSAIAVGEASPRYTVHPVYDGVPERIAQLMPQGRFIYLVREPIKRMQSQYLDNTIHGLEERPIEEALSVDPFYLTSSRYALQLRRYLEHFRREQILVIRSEEMMRDRGRILSRVFEFLGIDTSWRAPMLEEEFLKMNQRRAPHRRFRRVWYSSASRRVGRYLPRVVKKGFRTVTSRPVDLARGDLSPPFRHRLEELLRDDVRQLYGFLDQGFDGWGIA